jgi:hypothetical protein
MIIGDFSYQEWRCHPTITICLEKKTHDGYSTNTDGAVHGSSLFTKKKVDFSDKKPPGFGHCQTRKFPAGGILLGASRWEFV